ncbi:tyrosine-type recombinase/integrase [Streptomyces phaeochromogenes]
MLSIAMVGSVQTTDDPWCPYRLLAPGGEVVVPVDEFLKDLQATGRPETTQRSYVLALLRWYRFLWAVEVSWDRATRTEARDFSRWMQTADKPARVHWRLQRQGVSEGVPPQPAQGTPNAVTGKLPPGRKYAASTRAHSETVLRGFYDFHLEEGSGPLLNPFPVDRRRGGGRVFARHNPMEVFRPEQRGRYRPRVPRRAPRRIPDEHFNALFAALNYHRDRALLAFWVSTGARAAELLGCRVSDAAAGEQLIGVVRKGSRDHQQLPASADAFVWLRLYQDDLWRADVPRGRRQPLWWTLRRPWRPLLYPAARAMFQRANALLGANWTLHDLRHTAAYRMARDPQLPLTDVQWVLGHRQLSSTQVYLNPDEGEVLESVLAHHARQRERRIMGPAPMLAQGYRPEAMDILFGGRL